MPAGLLLLLLLVFSAPIVGLALAYNRLVGLRNATRNAFARLEAPLKERHVQVSALVVRARAARLSDEDGRLGDLIVARHGAASARAWCASHPESPDALTRLDAAERALDQALGALREPLLEPLLDALTAQIAFARQGFNDAVSDYNRAQSGLLKRGLAVCLRFQPARRLSAAPGGEGYGCPPVASC